MPNTADAVEPASFDVPLYDRIVRVIGAEIARGKIAPGARLLESRLASRFGVSRAPARQALGELEALGLVVHAAAPARGYIVVPDAARRASSFAAIPLEPFRGETTPIWQQIYGDVEEAVTKRIAFGDWRIVEAGIGQHYGVSRTVAREVLARLQSCGLVVNEGKRWIAPGLNETRVRELYELRALLEPAALSEVGLKIPHRRLDEMMDELQAARRTTPSGVTLDKLEADLHFDLLGRCRNSLLRKTMIESQSLLLAHRFFYKLTAEMYAVEPFLDEHLGILKDLRAGRLEEACEGMRRHLLVSSDRAVARVDKVRHAFSDDPPGYLEALASES